VSITLKIRPLSIVISLIFITMASYTDRSEARLRMFSRANCFLPEFIDADIGNESITWDPAGTMYWLWVNSSHHQRGELKHSLNGGMQYTWWYNTSAHRDPVGQSVWFVRGYHYRFDYRYGTFLDRVTQASGCNFRLGQFFP
jgi:hypothetical protein